MVLLITIQEILSQGINMKSELIVSFVDGSDVEINMSLEDKYITFVAFDEKSRKKYRLTFSDCISINMQYSIEDEPDLNNLTDGIQEIRTEDKSRLFKIGFADESNLEIRCNLFELIEL